MKENIYRYVVRDTENNVDVERFICSNDDNHAKFAKVNYGCDSECDGKDFEIISCTNAGVLEY